MSISTCTLSLYLYPLPLPVHYPSTCTLSLYLYPLPLPVPSPSTCALSLYLYPLPLPVHYACTCKQPPRPPATLPPAAPAVPSPASMETPPPLRPPFARSVHAHTTRTAPAVREARNQPNCMQSTKERTMERTPLELCRTDWWRMVPGECPVGIVAATTRVRHESAMQPHAWRVSPMSCASAMRLSAWGGRPPPGSEASGVPASGHQRQVSPPRTTAARESCSSEPQLPGAQGAGRARAKRPLGSTALLPGGATGVVFLSLTARPGRRRMLLDQPWGTGHVRGLRRTQRAVFVEKGLLSHDVDPGVYDVVIQPLLLLVEVRWHHWWDPRTACHV